MLKKLRSIQRSVDRHWVGNGFPVRTLFSYPKLGDVLSPFLLLDYAGPTEFEPTTERRGVGEHPHRGFETVTIVYAGEVEHRDSSGRRRPHRRRRRPVDDRGLGHRPRGVPRPRVRAARRAVRDGPALGQPAREGQEGAAGIPGDRGPPDPGDPAAGRARDGAGHRGGVRGSEGPGPHLHADAGGRPADERRDTHGDRRAGRLDHGARRAPRLAARRRRGADRRRPRSASSTARARASRSTRRARRAPCC